MDQALVAGIFGVSCALVGALAAYQGPLKAQRRALAHEKATASGQNLKEALNLAAELRVAGDIWARVIQQAGRDLHDGDLVDLDRFNQDVAALQDRIQTAAAQLVQYKIYVDPSSQGMLLGPMQEAEAAVRKAVATDPSNRSAYMSQLSQRTTEVIKLQRRINEWLAINLAQHLGIKLQPRPPEPNYLTLSPDDLA